MDNVNPILKSQAFHLRFLTLTSSITASAERVTSGDKWTTDESIFCFYNVPRSCETPAISLVLCHDNKAFFSFIPDNTSGRWNSQNRPGVRFWRYCSISSRRTAKGNKSGMSLSPLYPRYRKVQFFIPKINCRHCRIKQHRPMPTFIKCWGKLDLMKSQTW